MVKLTFAAKVLLSYIGRDARRFGSGYSKVVRLLKLALSSVASKMVSGFSEALSWLPLD